MTIIKTKTKKYHYNKIKFFLMVKSLCQGSTSLPMTLLWAPKKYFKRKFFFVDLLDMTTTIKKRLTTPITAVLKCSYFVFAEKYFR